MAKVEHYFTRFEEGEFYHIYNRSIDKKPLFIAPGNQNYFLLKLEFYIKDVAKIYAFCLLDNHFHILIKVIESLNDYRIAQGIDAKASVHDIVSKQFRRFFQCYVLSFNKQQNRCGTLFQTPFKRARVKDYQYLIHLVYYIHYNPQKHQLISDFKNWKWSSYYQVINDCKQDIQKELISWFENKEGYIDFHARGLTNFDNL